MTFLVSQHTWVILLGFLVMLLAAKQLGEWFTRFGLPLITGFLLMGSLAGPFGLGILPESALEDLRFLDRIALAFIAFAAGNELKLAELRPRLKSIGSVTVGLVFTTFLLTATAVFLFADHIPYLGTLPIEGKVAGALLAGSILVARSPSSAIAIVNELRAKGPFTQTVLGVTVIMDVLVIILFGINTEIADVLLRSPGFEVGFVFLILGELAISIGIGFLIGKAIGKCLALRLPSPVHAALVLVLGYLVFVGAHWLRQVTHAHLPFELFVEPLLICMISGFVVANRTEYWDPFSKILFKLGPAIYLVFFTLTGASLSLGILKEMWLLAILLSIVRLIAIVLGSYWGGFLAGEPYHQTRLSWMGYITQAGIGLGLAKEVAVEFPALGSAFPTLIISVIILNQLIGPPLLKTAIHRSGEAFQKTPDDETDGENRAIIFGHGNQALALARRLRKHDWEVTIASLAGIPIRNAGALGSEVVQINDLDDEAFHQLRISKATDVVALLSDDANLEISRKAREHNPRANVVVRLNNRAQIAPLQQLGVGIVDPDTVLVRVLEQFVRSPSAASLLLRTEPEHDIVELEVQNPVLHGAAIRDLDLPDDCFVLALKSKDRQVIPYGNAYIQAGDRITLGGSPESLEKLTHSF